MSATHTNDAEIKRLVKQHWENRASEFDAAPHHGVHSPAQRQAWQEVLGRLAGTLPLRVLDVGCGTGFLSLLLAELGHHVDGIDLAPEMLARARQKAETAGLDAHFYEGDAESLHFPDNRYDLIVERHLIWTLPDPEKAVREWLRVLKPGGRMALIEGDWGRRQQIKTEYQQIHNRLPFYGGQPSTKLREFLAALGVENIRVEPLIRDVLWGEAADQERYLMVGTRSIIFTKD